MTIEQLIEKKRQYNNLLEKLDVILKNINDSISEINVAIVHYKNSYTIDDDLVDKSVLLKVKVNLNEELKRINASKYRINSKIANVSGLMDDYYNSIANSNTNSSDNISNNVSSNHSSNTGSRYNIRKSVRGRR